MISVEGSNVLIDIEIDGQKLTEDFVKQNNIEVFACRLALTAGFATPVVSFVLGGTNLTYFNKFKEVNSAKFSIGTSVNEMDVFDWEIVGRDLKTGPQEVGFILHTGGIITKGNLNSMFHKDKTDEFYEGDALTCLTTAWKKEIGTEVDSNISNTKDISRKYKRNQMAQNYYFVDIFSHIDIRPSFPLATIDKNCNLVLRDFQKVLKNGFVHEFTYARHPMPDKVRSKLLSTQKSADVISYVGKPEVISYKTFSNRFCGYKQFTGVDTDTGKLSTVAASIINDEEGWKLNTLATTMANESSVVEHKFMDNQGINISSDTPVDYWAAALHNKEHSANMSSVQAKVIVEGKYLPNLKVLDLVKLSTFSDTKISGLYLVEALEIGFVKGSPFSTIVYLCRDNFNDVENTKSKQSKLLGKNLVISPSKKAAIINASRTSRRGLIHARNILDRTYIREWQRHLISMKSATMSNFWLFGTSVDLTDNISRATSLRNAGNILANKLINKFISPPFNMTLYNFLSKGSSVHNLFFSLIASILGSDMYGEFNQLVGDLILFDGFLDNYITTMSKDAGKTAVSDSGKTQSESKISQGYTSFEEKADGSISYNNNPVMEQPIMNIEEKNQVVSNIVEEIQKTIPESVDLPIPEISLTDSEVIKTPEEIKEIVVDKVVDDLIDKSYVYDSNLVDNTTGTTVYVVKSDGSVITGEEAKRTMLSSNSLKEILLGNTAFDSVASSKIKKAVGDELKIRHWGTFTTEDELLSFIITQGFSEKYRTVNTTKRMTVRNGKRIFVALPYSEKKVKFYINSERVIMNEVEMDDLGYFTATGKPIPYNIYYTTNGYNSNNVLVELRKEL